MIIKDSLTLSDIQKEFETKYPYLKLEFYSKEHDPGEGTQDAHKLDATKTIGDIRAKHNEGSLSIDENLKVSELEEAFENIYGLNVQVFRKSREIYLQTTATDHWTLAEQNKKGMQES